jgi:carbon-monoxide dehydrogenase medium subunit
LQATVLRLKVEPESDIHATADYRRHIVGVVAEQALREAERNAREAEVAGV